MAGLDRVKIQPLRLMKPLGGGSVAMTMIGDQMAPPASLLQTPGHRYPDLFIAAWSRVAAHIPEHCIVLITLSKEPAEDVRIVGVEHPLRMGIDMPGLGDDQPHHKPQFVGPIYDIIHILEEDLIRPGR